MLSLKTDTSGTVVKWTLTDSVTGLSAECDGNTFTETWIRANAELLMARVNAPYNDYTEFERKEQPNE